MDTLGGEATIRWDFSIGVGGWGSLKLSDRLRTCRELGVKGQAGQHSPPPVQPQIRTFEVWSEKAETRSPQLPAQPCTPKG